MPASIAPVLTLRVWLALQAAEAESADASVTRLVLSLRADASAMAAISPTDPTSPTNVSSDAAISPTVWLLSGPEGGLTAAEEDAARKVGFQPVSLGPRILRADTAPLAALSWFSLARNLPGSG